ncbi:MAG: nucleotidyltransferase domain-containing protein [Planctomycetes bacterium]|nr:nucleotidyltransferase domain-containing protein [Planctomycetota bacterium]
MFDLRAHTHLLTIAGSRAHGLHTEASDVDLKGMAVPPKAFFHGIRGEFEQADDAAQFPVFLPDLTAPERAIAGRSGVEGSVYGIQKFLRLASKSNPNVLECLFSREQEVRILSPLGERLREARSLFLSAQCVQTFSGYAANQLTRIRLHYRWHHQGPVAAPKRADFDLPESALLPPPELEAAQNAVQKQLDRWELDLTGMDKAERIKALAGMRQTLTELGLASDESLWEAGARWIGLDASLVHVMKREREYRRARSEWRQYQDWKANRNSARAELEATHGYDTKHGAHLVRLLRMGSEIARTGECIVWRADHDGDELRAIRGGAWSYDKLIEWSDARRLELRQLKRVGMVVPARPDHEAIDALCVELVEMALAC